MAKVADAVKEDEQVAPAESAPVNTKVNEPVDGDNSQVSEDKDIMEATLDELEEDAPETEGEAEEEAPAETEAAVETTQPQGETKPQEPTQTEEKLAPKSENRFQILANKNKDLEQKLSDPSFLQQQLERLKLQESQLASEQELLNEVNPETGEYYTPQEVERLAFAQSREQRAQVVALERYQLEVQQNQELIANEATKAIEDFAIFNDKSPEFKPELAAQLNDLIDKSLIREEGTGTIIGAHLSPYQLAKTIADATQVNAAKMQAEAQKANAKMLANADVPAGASNASKAKVDPDLAAFDEEAGL